MQLEKERISLIYGVYISKKSGRLKSFITSMDKEAPYHIGVVVSDAKIEDDLLCLLGKKKIKYVEFEYECLGKENTGRRQKFSELLLKELQKYACEYCFSFGSHLLTGRILTVYKYRLINFHPSLLPMYPGKNAIDQAEKDGKVLLVGNSAHFIDEGVDSGPLIMQSVVPIQGFLDTKNYDMILDLQVEMMRQIMDVIECNCLKVIDGRVYIENADYRQSYIFPVWKKDSQNSLKEDK